MKKQMFVAVTVLAAACASLPAFAEEKSGWYLGAGAGQVTAEEPDFGLKGTDTAFKVFGGYQVNNYVGFELAYIDGGTPNDAIGVLYAEADIQAVQASILPSVPLSENFSLYGRLGLLKWDADVYLQAGNSFGGYSNDGNDFSWGAGMKLAAGRFVIRAEYEQSDIDTFDYQLISGSISFLF